MRLLISLASPLSLILAVDMAQVSIHFKTRQTTQACSNFVRRAKRFGKRGGWQVHTCPPPSRGGRRARKLCMAKVDINASATPTMQLVIHLGSQGLSCLGGSGLAHMTVARTAFLRDAMRRMADKQRPGEAGPAGGRPRQRQATTIVQPALASAPTTMTSAATAPGEEQSPPAARSIFRGAGHPSAATPAIPSVKTGPS